MRNLKFVLLLAEPEPGGGGGGKMVECKSLSEGLRSGQESRWGTLTALLWYPAHSSRHWYPHQQSHCTSTLAQHWLSWGFLLLVTLTVTKDVNSEHWAGLCWLPMIKVRHLETPPHTSTSGEPLAASRADRRSDNGGAIFSPRGYCCTKMYKSSCQVVAPVRGSAPSSVPPDTVSLRQGGQELH